MSEVTARLMPILNHYDLTPISVIQEGQVMKIATSKGNFALKRLPVEYERNFLDIQSWLRSFTIPALPVFVTKYGEPIVRRGESIFYLSPWVEDQSSNTFQKWELLTDVIARLHRRSSQNSEINRDMSKDYRWEERQVEWEKFMSRAEHQTYPSPFEQRILLLFSRIMADFELTRHTIDGLMRGEKDNRVVLCHGQPIPDNLYLIERSPYLHHFEQAYWGSPVTDLALIFQHPDISPEWFNRFYHQYQTVNPLTLNEKKQLMAEIINPRGFEKLVSDYQNQNSPSELEFIGKLHDLSERRQRVQSFFTFLEKEISDETNVSLDPSLEKTDVEGNEQDEDDNIEGRRPEDGSDHLENS